jgi:hypothetical protein
MLIRMTETRTRNAALIAQRLRSQITGLAAAGAVATGGLLAGGAALAWGLIESGSGPTPLGPPNALIVDAAAGREGRELVDPRPRTADAEVRLPRTAAEARTNVRYFDAQGYRVVVAGPKAREAAASAGVPAVTASGVRDAIAAVASR